MPIYRNSGIPVGMIVMLGHLESKVGYLPAVGGLVNIADAPRLFAKWGTTYGGDGVTNFGMIDMRGEAVRGLDQGRGVDPGRVLGSAQAHQSNNVRNLVTGTVSDGTNDTGDLPENGDYAPFWAETGDEGANPNYHIKARLWGRETRMRNLAFPFYVKT